VIFRNASIERKIRKYFRDDVPLEPLWILNIVYMVESNTTNTVVDIVFMINGPLPRFKRSNTFTINFRIGFAKDSVRITVNSIDKSENKSCNIFVELLEYQFQW
jgi:hypothetical protein